MNVTIRCLQYLASFFETDLHEFFLILWEIDGLQQTTVWCYYKWNSRSQNSLTTRAQLYNKILEEKSLYLYYVYVVTPNYTNDNVTTTVQSFFHKANVNTDTWVRNSLVC